MTEYNILLNAAINPVNNIQSSLNSMAKSVSLTISNIKIDPAALTALQTQIGNATNKGSGGATSSGGSTSSSPSIDTNTTAVQKFNAALSEMNPTATTTNNVLQQMTKATQAESDGLDSVTKRTISLNPSLTQFKDVTTESSVATKGLSGDIANAVEKMAMWAVAGTALYGSLQQIQKGIQYIIDLNTAMTQTQMVTGETDTQIQQLAADYNNMATELGSTTLEVQAASLAWMRQGKSAADAEELTKDSIMMSKLAMTDTATASEYLTAILNGFQMSASDATSVMDKMLALSNSTKTSAAVSFQTISEAMKVSAAEANNTGVSYDKLASYIGVIGTVTQQSGETIGNSLNKFGALWYN